MASPDSLDFQTINTPGKLHQAIGKFLQSDYSHESLIKMYDDARKCAIGFRGIYPALPALPAYKDNPLDGLQDIMDWCIESIETVDNIVSILGQQTISTIISRFKKLKGFSDHLSSLVNNDLREQAQNEARAKIENEYKNLNEKASKLKEMPFIRQAEVIGVLQLEEQDILRREAEDAVQLYLSKDPTFIGRLSQQDKEVRKVIEKINTLTGSKTPTGKLLDIYCKLTDIPLPQQFQEVGYACSLTDDVILGKCNRLRTSIDNVIKIFEEIQKKAKQENAKISIRQRIWAGVLTIYEITIKALFKSLLELASKHH